MIHEKGKIVGSMYEIVGLVGQGGMGAVYQARDLRDMGMVALKQMREDTSAGLGAEKMRAKFEQEWQILKSLDHKRIPHMMAAFHEDDSIYYVMEFVEGKSLALKVRELKQAGKRFPEILLLEYTLQLLDVLEYLHSRTSPVLHRDIKPENVIVRDDNGEIVLVDFGLARGFGESAGQNTQTQVGTLGFAPIEQVKGKPEIRSDIYGVGATMWYMLTGEIPQPFEIQPIEEMRNDLFPGISEVVNRACQGNVNRRYATASRMELAVRQALANLQGVPLDARGEALFVDDGPVNAPVVPAAPMPAAVFLMQALVAVSIVMGGIFLIAAMKDQIAKTPPAPTSSPPLASTRIERSQAPTAEPRPQLSAPADPTESDYRLLEQTQPIYAHQASSEEKQTYRNWLGSGWELAGLAGKVAPGGQLSASPGESAVLFFTHAQGVQVHTLNWSMSRTGGQPASVHILLGTRSQPPQLSVISNFQAGHYMFALLAGGQPQFVEAPRHPIEESMNAHLILAGGNASLTVDGVSKPVEIPVNPLSVNSVQVILPPASKSQSVQISSLNVQ